MERSRPLVTLSLAQVCSSAGMKDAGGYVMRKIVHGLIEVDGNPTRVHKRFRSEHAKIDSYRRFCSTIPDLPLDPADEVVINWSTRDLEGMPLRDIEHRVRWRLVLAAVWYLDLGSNRKIAKYYAVDESVVRQIVKRAMGRILRQADPLAPRPIL